MGHGSTQPGQGRVPADWLREASREALYDHMVREELLQVIVVIGEQGPEAFGMPEMFTPMQHINANRELRKLAALVSDGRYSGTSYGAAIGHVTPEAIKGGMIGLLETGDLIHIDLRGRRLDLVAPDAFVAGRLTPWNSDTNRIESGPFVSGLVGTRHSLGEERCRRIAERRLQIAVTNRMRGVSDASRGVVPEVVAEEAAQSYSIA